MRLRLAFISVFVFSVLLWAPSLSARTLERLSTWCRETYETMRGGRFADIDVPIATAARELPGVGDITRLDNIVRERRRVWQLSNPKDPDNFSMPEHKEGVEWLKSALDGLPANSHGAYRDDVQRAVEEPWRKEMRQELMAKLKSLEHDGYPNRRTIEVAEDVTHFLAVIDRTREPGIMLQVMKRTHADLDIDRYTLEALASQRAKADDATGDERRALQMAYENDFLTAVVKSNKKRGMQSPKEAELRLLMRQEHRNLAIGERALRFEMQRKPDQFMSLLSDGVFLVTPHEISVRGLAEMALFNVHPGGLTLKPLSVDGETLDAAKYFGHDRGHYAIANFSDPYAKKVMALSREKKLEILKRLNAIEDPRQLALAEYVVVAATREFLAHALVPRKAEGIEAMKRSFKTTMGEDVSDEEAKWMIDWAHKNIPVRVGWFR